MMDYTVLTDASFATTKSGRAQLGYLTFLNGSLVGFKSKLSKIVALSTTEAETCACSEGTKEILHGYSLLSEMGIDVTPVHMGVDNLGSVKNANGAGGRATRHIEYRLNHMRAVVRDKVMQIFHLPGTVNASDLLTKPLRDKGLFEFL